MEGPRWLLLLALVYAPWAYGSTRDWTIALLNFQLGLILALWTVGCILRRALPKVPALLGAACLWLIVQGWWMVLNATFDYVEDPAQVLGFDHALRYALPALVDVLPGSYHKTASWSIMPRIALLLLILLFACDLARRRAWRQRLLWTMGLTGLSIVLLGVAQHVTHAPSIFWSTEDLGKSFFATYRNRCNAGAYLNLVWPIFAGLCVAAFHHPGGPRRKWLLGAATIFCLAGVLVNTSRAAHFIAGFLVILWLIWTLVQNWRGRLAVVHSASASFTLMLLGLLTVGVAMFAGLAPAMQRWQGTDPILSPDNARWLTARVCLDMLPEAGWCGFGPGTFATMFPYYTDRFGNALTGVWIYAHEDYLQTLIEWGYLGGAVGVLIWLGALLRAWQGASARAAGRDFGDQAMQFALFTLLVGVLLHAAVDFPLQIHSIQLYVVVALGILWGFRQTKTGRSNQLLPAGIAAKELVCTRRALNSLNRGIVKLVNR